VPRKGPQVPKDGEPFSKGGWAGQINLSNNQCIAHSTRPEDEKTASVFTSLWSVRNIEAVFYKILIFGLHAWQSTSSPLCTCQQRWRSHLSWPVLGIFLVLGAWYFLCVAKKGGFTSEASPLCLGRAHKFLRTVGHSPP
jgi:hypothetical protein